MTESGKTLTFCLEDAEDFLNASDILFDQLDVDEKGYPKNFSFGAPYAVLASYSIESSIKNILIIYNVPYGRGHNLLNFFKLLPDKVQRRVINETSKLWNDKVFIESDDEIFKQLLSLSSNNFVGTRYLFEHKDKGETIHITFLKKLSHTMFKALKEEIKNKE